MSTTMITPTIAPTFTLDVTRRVYAIDAITGAKSAYFVRNYTIVG